ncbi:MAG: hypothetical protein QXP42_01170 [Candidatus Micrarchaeia archaeon]
MGEVEKPAGEKKREGILSRIGWRDLLIPAIFVFLLIAVTVGYFLLFPYDYSKEIKMEVKMAPLKKVAKFSPPKGHYAYEMRVLNSSSRVEFDVLDKGICTPISGKLTGEGQNVSFWACVYEDGKYDGVNVGGVPINTSLDFFQEWMLAVDDGWRWQVNITTKYERLGNELVDVVDYGATEITFKGRSAYDVRITMNTARGGARTEKAIIDKESRLVLERRNEYVSIVLIEAPFT